MLGTQWKKDGIFSKNKNENYYMNYQPTSGYLCKQSEGKVLGRYLHIRVQSSIIHNN